jgi:hypothetical protein
MSTVLKGVVLGDENTGKTSFFHSLCPAKPGSIELTDPSSNNKIKFLLEESLLIKPKTVCAFLVYSIESFDSFESVQNKWLKVAQTSMNLSNSFIIIIGTHSDSSHREVDPHEAEELAASNGAFHMEISNVSKRNVELTLKLVRIRAFYLIKKHPEIKCEDEEGSVSLETGSSLNMDIPLPFKDFSSIQSRKNRYEGRSFAESVYGSKEVLTEKNMSFADMQDSMQSSDYCENDSEEPLEISIDTLGSPSWHQKVPPLSFFPSSLNSHPQTERSSHSKLLESGSSTERNRKEPLLVLDIQLDNCLKKVEVYPEDNAYTLAEKALNKSYSHHHIEDLAEIISRAINDYISQVRNYNLKKPLYKVKIAIGSKWGEIVVHEGDSLEEIARSYVVENSLPKNYEQNILKLLLEAGEKYYS